MESKFPNTERASSVLVVRRDFEVSEEQPGGSYKIQNKKPLKRNNQTLQMKKIKPINIKMKR